MKHDRITEAEFQEGCQFLGNIAVVVLFLILGALSMWVKQ